MILLYRELTNCLFIVIMNPSNKDGMNTILIKTRVKITVVKVIINLFLLNIVFIVKKKPTFKDLFILDYFTSPSISVIKFVAYFSSLGSLET